MRLEYQIPNFIVFEGGNDNIHTLTKKILVEIFGDMPIALNENDIPALECVIKMSTFFSSSSVHLLTSILERLSLHKEIILHWDENK